MAIRKNGNQEETAVIITITIVAIIRIRIIIITMIEMITMRRIVQ